MIVNSFLVKNFRPVCPSRLAAGLLLAAVLLTAGALSACNIPVFRYSLERWKSDDTTLVLYVDGDLSADQNAAVTKMRARCRLEGGNANASFVVVDLSDSDQKDEAQDLVSRWDELKLLPGVKAPYMLIRTQLSRGRVINPWHGTLADAERIGIFQSPARMQLRDRLLAGDSVVWLMVGDPDSARTKAAKEKLQAMFKTLEAKVTLPEGIGLPGSELYADIPLIVRFSLIEINPSDPREQFLVNLLTGVRRQAFEEGEPLLVPVFGRGRALEVVPASDASSGLVEDLMVFLSGACSCQVKEQNPGFDLLIEADWEDALFGGEENRPPDRSAQEGQNRQPTLVPIPPGRNGRKP